LSAKVGLGLETIGDPIANLDCFRPGDQLEALIQTLEDAMTPHTVDEYIAGFPSDVARILTQIRATVRSAAPGAKEKISYNMPTFWSGKGIIHFGAFKGHIGIYPPVREPDLAERVAPYRGEKGNLRLPLDQPIPYDLIADIVKARVMRPASSGSKRASRQAV
jgi:uncharacterized protein YdhG (YjbR/CyaY superfamily)